MAIPGRASLTVAALLASLLSSTAACGQQITRVEVGLGLYGQSDAYNTGASSTSRTAFVGPFLRTTLNLNSSVALEAFAAESSNSVPTEGREGGHETLLLAGVKAGVRRRHMGVFGVLDLGAASYTHGDELYSLPPTFYRETHVTLQPGLAVEGYLTRRTIVRADVQESLAAAFRSPVVAIGANAYSYIRGQVSNHLGVSLSVEHRLGALHDAPSLAPRPERFTVGAFFPLQLREHTLENNIPALGGGGAWIEIPNFRFLSTDLVAFDLPQDDHTATGYDGGTSFSGFAGPKVGLHLGGLGVFAKARPGLTRFSRTASSASLSSTSVLQLINHPQVDFSLDTGGVVEYAAKRHVVLRLEGGDAMIFYRPKTVTNTVYRTEYVSTYPAERKSTMLFLSGVGWRF